jgi:gluconolactonase
MSVTVLAQGLKFPEGPIILPDGAVIMVEIDAGALIRIWNGKREVIAQLGGGPNGAAIGPDGAIYVCNNGGQAGDGADGSLRLGRIERVDPATGRFERLFDSVAGNSLSAPNDIVFDKAGGFWFTDFGRAYARHRDTSGIYYATPDGGQISEVSYGSTGFNGIGLSPDEKTLYAAETHTGRLIAFDLVAAGQVVKGGRGGRLVTGQADGRLFDSLAVQADGAICVATIGASDGVEGGITTMTPEGESSLVHFPDRIVTNICFGGADMRDAYMTLSGTGRLVSTRWPSPGLKLNYNPY